MDGYLKQSTAGQVRWIGPFVDDTDFKTAETGLTIANTDIKVSKNGGASASKNSGGGTHDVNGFYAVTWDATDSATVGELKYSVKVAGALQVFGSYVVLEEAVYDALFASSAPGYLQPTTAGRTLDVSAGGEAGVDWANVGSPTTAVDLSGTTIKTTQQVDVNTIKTQTVTCAAGVTVLASVGTAATSTAQTGDSFARLGAPEGASIAADIAAAKAAIDTIDDFVDTEVAAILAAVDTEVAAIKAQTDALTFTATNFLQVDLKKINGTTVNGDGSGTPWGP